MLLCKMQPVLLRLLIVSLMLWMVNAVAMSVFGSPIYSSVFAIESCVKCISCVIGLSSLMVALRRKLLLVSCFSVFLSVAAGR